MPDSPRNPARARRRGRLPGWLRAYGTALMLTVGICAAPPAGNPGGGPPITRPAPRRRGPFAPGELAGDLVLTVPLDGGVRR